ncbi:MAG: helix-turn-helix domain-containing protein [Desulfobacula sp.]|uniref:helix-turn-helix domain-containing protein n=1 Tax=Desulfobacula sp. TaxID=2593537 RepID=UPI0025BA26B9|nr:helix-turn-helix transcriptional regulator [Desulfobacula sp.]MCD4720623.1 helix-turn-helix domain-containing protein [Desulfobacula sp.]
MSLLNKRLKKTIKLLQLTREEFAVLCGVSRSQLYRYLSGEQQPGVSFLQNLQNKFQNVDINWLLTGIEQPSDTEFWLALDTNESPNPDLWVSLQAQGLKFETRISAMFVFEAMKETKHVLEDIERENLANFIAKHEVTKLYKSVIEHVLLLKKIRVEKEKIDSMKRAVEDVKFKELNKKLAKERLESKQGPKKKNNE